MTYPSSVDVWTPAGPPPTLSWRKSSRSIPDGECVEVANTGSHVYVRDSRTTSGGVLCFTGSAWKEFLHALTSDRLANCYEAGGHRGTPMR